MNDAPFMRGITLLNDISDGSYKTKYNVGDVINLKIGTAFSRNGDCIIIGKDIDIDSDGNTIPLTLMPKYQNDGNDASSFNGIWSSYFTNSFTESEYTVWNSSNLRAKINDAMLSKGFDNLLFSRVVPSKRITTSNITGTGSYITYDKFFVLSPQEINCNNTYCIKFDNSITYTYFSNNERRKVLHPSSADAYTYALRGYCKTWKVPKSTTTYNIMGIAANTGDFTYGWTGGSLVRTIIAFCIK